MCDGGHVRRAEGVENTMISGDRCCNIRQCEVCDVAAVSSDRGDRGGTGVSDPRQGTVQPFSRHPVRY
jgi:hypothetical protein